MEQFEFGGETVWQPTAEYVARSHLKWFMDRHGITTFGELAQVPSIKRTLNQNLGDLSALENSQAVEEIRKAV